MNKWRAVFTDQVATIKLSWELMVHVLNSQCFLYTIVEPTRIPGYTDDQMFEANANNEFTITNIKEGKYYLFALKDLNAI